MDTYSGILIVIGVLYLVVFIAGILSIAPSVDSSDYLTKSARNPNQLYKAVCFQFLMMILYLGIGVLLYPMLKIDNEGLALGFLISRIIAGVFVLTGTIILLLIFGLSQEFVKMNASDSSHYTVIGDLLKTARDLVNHVGMIIVLCIGGILLNLVMIQSELIPTWLSVWGILGAVIAIIASVLALVKRVEIISPVYLILNVPLVLQEIVFAVYLILKGFKLI
ncbi:hypothetical protein D3C71_888190 [compost metagenome]